MLIDFNLSFELFFLATYVYTSAIFFDKLFPNQRTYSQVRDKDLEEMFEKHGPIKELKVILDRDTGRSKGFAFITFENPGDADAAKEALNGEDLLGRQIRVDNSTPKGQGPSRGGGGGGGDLFLLLRSMII